MGEEESRKESILGPGCLSYGDPIRAIGGGTATAVAAETGAHGYSYTEIDATDVTVSLFEFSI